MKTDRLTTVLAAYLGIALISGVVLYFFVIAPIYASGVAAKANADAQSTKLKALNQLAKDTDALRQNYREVRDKRDQVLSLLPVESEEERLLVLLSDLAKQSGVVMGTFAPQPALTATQETITSSVSSYPATINVSGTYTNIQSFLKKLENAGRFINVDSGIFSSAGAGGSVDARLSLTAYYQADNTVTATVGGAR